MVWIAGSAWVGLLGVVVGLWEVHRRIKSGLGDPGLRLECERLRQAVVEIADQVKDVRADYARIMDWRDDVTIAVAEGVKHVERQENRIRATVRRAREELAERGYEHPGLEAEAEELRGVDVEGGAESEVPTVQPSLDGDRAAALAALPGSWEPGDFDMMGL